MPVGLKTLLQYALRSVRDLTPIVLVIGSFQLFLIQAPLDGVLELLIGAFMVLAGLTLFIYGLELALFPIGEALAYALARKGSLFWLIAFSFLMGFGTAVAEPALTAVASEAAIAAAQAGAIADTDAARSAYMLGLRVTVAFSVGAALVIGVLRIVFAWNLPLMMAGGFMLVVVMSAVAPAEIIGVAYDLGSVTTSVVTVPLVGALGIGLASSLANRNPMTDGFGLIALASLGPMIFVMAYGSIIAWN